MTANKSGDPPSLLSTCDRGPPFAVCLERPVHKVPAGNEAASGHGARAHRTISACWWGREPEQQRIAQLLAAARLGQSGVVVLLGEAGIGKSALLDDTAAHAGDMVVMRTSGSERESALGFSGLHQLLRPALHLVDHIPGPQSEALAVALMLRHGPAPERFAVAAATLSLLSRYAEDSPLLVLVDDAHLLNPPSAETLRFVARRLLADPIALLMSVRPEPDTPFTYSDLPVLAH